MRALVAYATCHGSTREIAERITARLESSGLTADCRSMREVSTPERYDAAILGSAVHDQRWLPEATDFLERLRAARFEQPVWLFSVGMPGALPGRLRGWAMQEEGQLSERLRPLTPAASSGHRLFSGVVRKDHLSAAGRARFRLMGGRYGDFRDWGAIEAWADSVAASLASP